MSDRGGAHKGPDRGFWSCNPKAWRRRWGLQPHPPPGDRGTLAHDHADHPPHGRGARPGGDRERESAPFPPAGTPSWELGLRAWEPLPLRSAGPVSSSRCRRQQAQTASGQRPPPRTGTDTRPFAMTFLPGFHGNRIGRPAPLRPAALLFSIHWPAVRSLSFPKGTVVWTRHSHPFPCAQALGLGHTRCWEPSWAPPRSRICAAADRHGGATAGPQARGTGSSPRYRPPLPQWLPLCAPLMPSAPLDWHWACPMAAVFVGAQRDSLVA